MVSPVAWAVWCCALRWHGAVQARHSPVQPCPLYCPAHYRTSRHHLIRYSLKPVSTSSKDSSAIPTSTTHRTSLYKISWLTAHLCIISFSHLHNFIELCSTTLQIKEHLRSWKGVNDVRARSGWAWCLDTIRLSAVLSPNAAKLILTCWFYEICCMFCFWKLVSCALCSFFDCYSA